MKLGHQVVSLDLAKRLKELGVKQESHFYWDLESSELIDVEGYSWRKDTEGKPTSNHPNAHILKGFLSAFTVAELLELVPHMLMGSDPDHMIHQLLLEKQATQYKAMYVCATCKGVLVGIERDTAANALAETFADMIESNLLTV